ncbi:unnamed protein product [Chilo suppressalis]|uniref:Uncharacterized protein n=1 Tax=Chilo suppressalis TaxID=168631 RepID=A0ABN8ATL5_CHISP|nr:unnamed protein product [Chilo suppressalis]
MLQAAYTLKHSTWRQINTKQKHPEPAYEQCDTSIKFVGYPNRRMEGRLALDRRLPFPRQCAGAKSPVTEYRLDGAHDLLSKSFIDLKATDSNPKLIFYIVEMANEHTGKPKEFDKSALNNAVLWCLSVFVLLFSGYGLYRQHCLEQRVLVLEKEQLMLKKLVQQNPVDPEKLLRRETRDANDCICPADKKTELAYIYNISMEVVVIPGADSAATIDLRQWLTNEICTDSQLL